MSAAQTDRSLRVFAGPARAWSVYIAFAALVLFELDAIAASVIGGTPLSGGRISTIGTIFGVLLLEVLGASFIMNNVNGNYAQMLKAAFIIGALYLQRAEG